MPAEQIQLRVTLSAGDLDDDALAECVTMLAQEVAEFDVDDVTAAPAGDAPPGAKGVELVELGALIVKLAGSAKLLGQLVGAVREWMTRNHADSVRLEIDGDVIEIKGATEAERKALVDAWVQRHTDS